MKAKVLVTGANGQLAKAIESISESYSDSVEFHFVSKNDLDISNNDAVTNFFKTHHFDYCINCAAYTNVELAEAEEEKAYQINADAVKALAENCKENEVVLIHISTDYVFDGSRTSPYSEHDQTNPLNIYGKSKLLGEQYVQEILNKYFIIRTSWLYSQFGKNFAKTISNKLESNNELEIITSETGTPTSCNDLAVFILYLIKNKVMDFGLYHFSASGFTTWYGFALLIGKKLGKEHLISKIDSFPMKAERPKYSVLDNKKAQTLIKKEFFWEESVSEVLSKL